MVHEKSLHGLRPSQNRSVVICIVISLCHASRSKTAAAMQAARRQAYLVWRLRVALRSLACTELICTCLLNAPKYALPLKPIEQITADQNSACPVAHG